MALVTALSSFAIMPKQEVQAAGASVVYKAHVQSHGWMGEKRDGQAAGTTGQSKRIEVLQIKLNGAKGSIEYRVHGQSYGWRGWKKNGELAGTTGKAKRLEAIEIKLGGSASGKYDIVYRTHCQSVGWTPWVMNGITSGTIGQTKRMEAIQVKVLTKGKGEEFLTQTANNSPASKQSGGGGMDWRNTIEQTAR